MNGSNARSDMHEMKQQPALLVDRHAVSLRTRTFLYSALHTEHVVRFCVLMSFFWHVKCTLLLHKHTPLDKNPLLSRHMKHMSPIGAKEITCETAIG